MSLKLKLTTALSLTIAIAGISTAVSAQDAAPAPKDGVERTQKHRKNGMHHVGGKGMHGDRRGAMLRGLRELNLTVAQKEQIRAIREANRPDTAKNDEIRSLMEAKRAGTLTAEQKETLLSYRKNARAKGDQIREQILAILTAEQRQQLERKQQEMTQLREERRQLRREQRKTIEKPIDN